MKTMISMIVTCLALTLAGCGLQEGDTDAPDGGGSNDDGGGNTDDGGGATPQTLPAPFKSGAPYVLDFSIAYINESLCGELRGNLPGVTWASGPALADRDPMGNYDGYLGTAFTAPEGDYRMSYVDAPCAGETGLVGDWAGFGNLKTQMPLYKPEDRAFLYCEQYVPADNKCVQVQNPGCEIRIHMDASGNVTPRGNMRDYDAATATGCN